MSERERSAVRTLPRAQTPVARYIDVALLFLAAPILLSLGAPLIGYGIGAGAWILLRALGVAVDRYLVSIDEIIHQLSVRLAYRFARVLVLAAATILARGAGGNDDGLVAVLVILVAFTVQLSLSIVAHQRPQAAVAGSPGSLDEQ